MLEAWLNTGMAAPHVMATATWGNAQQCTATTPTLLSATPGNAEITLEWQEEADVNVYKVYLDQAGKSIFVADVIVDEGFVPTYTDTGLTNGSEYCYKVTSYTADCESTASNVICAIPNNQGLARVGATLSTGLYQTTGKGKDKVTVFVETSAFAAGDAVTVRATVLDQATGLPVPNATVNIDITGPETMALVTGQSDANGIAEAVWQTQAPNRKGQGGTTPGSYSATTSDVVAAGYSWDGEMTTTTFTLQ